MKKVISNLATAFTVMGIAGGAVAAECDLAGGEKIFKRCKACHKLEEGKNGIGPHLFGIVGRDAASVDGFKYSEAMKAYGGVWDASRIDSFLTSPKKEVKGTKMSFAGLRKEEQRAAVICYLETIK